MDVLVDNIEPLTDLLALGAPQAPTLVPLRRDFVC